jgi:hypothetical protein
MKLQTLIACAGLLLIGGCGGGGDVTSPPTTQTFAVSVAGGGGGNGVVNSQPGLSPAITCTITAGVAQGPSCTAEYPQGTRLTLAAAPDNASEFAGWSGVSGCGTAPVCAFDVTQSTSAVAGFSVAPAAVTLLSYATYTDPNFAGMGAIIWVADVRNNSQREIESATVNLTTYNAAGQILTTDALYVGPIPTGEARADQGYADYLGSEATIRVQLGEVRYSEHGGALTGAAIVNSNWRVDKTFAGSGAVIWTAEVQNTGAQPLESVRVDFSTYDQAGSIVAADVAFTDPIPPGETRAVQGYADYHGTEATAKFVVGNVR